MKEIVVVGLHHGIPYIVTRITLAGVKPFYCGYVQVSSDEQDSDGSSTRLVLPEWVDVTWQGTAEELVQSIDAIQPEEVHVLETWGGLWVGFDGLGRRDIGKSEIEDICIEVVDLMNL